VCDVWADRWVEGEGKEGWAEGGCGEREKVRVAYRV